MEVLFCHIGRTVVETFAFVDQNDLVEQLVQGLASLVKGDRGRDVSHIGQ